MLISMRRLFVYCLAGLVIQGCIATSPIPNTVRTGDYVTLGIGGAKRIANMNLLKPSDIEATLTQEGFSYQLKIINVIRVYPDRSSSYAVMSITRDADVWGSDYSMTPFDGGWLVQARLTDSSGTVLPLNPGPASIAVTSPTGKLVQIDGNYDGDLDNFNVETADGFEAEPEFEVATSDFESTVKNLEMAISTNKIGIMLFSSPYINGKTSII